MTPLKLLRGSVLVFLTMNEEPAPRTDGIPGQNGEDIFCKFGGGRPKRCVVLIDVKFIGRMGPGCCPNSGVVDVLPMEHLPLVVVAAGAAADET